MGAVFSGLFSSAAGRRLRSLGIYLLVVGITCLLSAATVIGLLGSCSYYNVRCGQDVYCYLHYAIHGGVACTATSTVFVVAGSLAVAASRRRNRCLLLTSILFSSLAAIGAVAVIAVGGASILPDVASSLSMDMPDEPDMSTTYRYYDGCNITLAWAQYPQALATWERNILMAKLSLACTVLMMTLALVCLTLSLWSAVHVCRSVFSTAYCKTLCPGCWTWCFDRLEDGGSAVPLTSPTTPPTDCDKHPLAAAMVTQENVTA